MTIAETAKAAYDALTYPDRKNFANDADHAAAWHEYRFVQVPAVEKTFKEALAAEYLPAETPTEVADKVFALAWEHGHSSGYSEVESYYIDFAELVHVTVKSFKQ